MSKFLLSIVIPTFNREAAMQLLLSDIHEVLQNHLENVQIVISDNCSTDGTKLLIDRYRPLWGNALKVVMRKTNIGMEGNIACAIHDADGKYIWMLSDHQRLCTSEVSRVIHKMAHQDFDIGHAKILQWSAVLPVDRKNIDWIDMTLDQRGALLFSLTNLSTLIFRRALGEAAMKSIFQSCVWGFPHMGIIAQINDKTRVIEFDSMSSFPDIRISSALVHDYDKIIVRYHSSTVCVKTLAKRANISFSFKGFYTAEYRAAFFSDVLNLLVQRGASRRSTTQGLIKISVNNPIFLKIVALFVLLCFLLLPNDMRIRMALGIKLIITRILHKTKSIDCVTK